MIFILAVFICYRLTRLLVIDDGPYDAFLKLRTRLGVADLGADDRPKTQLGRILSCVHCLGIYLSFPLAFLMANDWMVFWWWLAIAGAQSAIASLAGHDDKS